MTIDFEVGKREVQECIVIAKGFVFHKWQWLEISDGVTMIYGICIG